MAAGALTVFLLLAFTGDEGSSSSVVPVRTPDAVAKESPSDVEPSSDPARFATESATNRDGGYSFAHPPRWEVVSDGSVSTITSPRSNAVITIGFGPSGSLAAAATDLSELIQASYQVLRMGPPRETFIGDSSALTFSGRATNDESVTITFQVTAVQGPEANNYAVTVFSYPDIARALIEAVEEVVNSFRVAAAS